MICNGGVDSQKVGRGRFSLAFQLPFVNDWTILGSLYAWEWEALNLEVSFASCLCWDLCPCNNFLSQVSRWRLLKWSVQSHANFAFELTSKGNVAVFVKANRNLNCIKMPELYFARVVLKT